MELVNFWNLIVVLGAMAAGVVYIRSALVKQRHDELEALASTRGDRIADLQQELAAIKAAYQTEISELKGQVRELRGQMDAVQVIKAQEIALEVARLLSQQMTRTREDFDPNSDIDKVV